MDLLIRILVRAGVEERGQSLVLFASMLVVLLLAVGVAVDAGQLVVARTDLQKTADAAVFAGVQELPDKAKAVDVAHDYLHKNSDWSTNHDFSVTSTRYANDTLTVVAKKRVNYTFMRVIGKSGADVSARATARRGVYGGGSGLLPFGFIASNDPTSTLLQNSCYNGSGADGLPTFKQNQPCTLKFGAGTNAGGDFGAVVLDGVGANEYRDDIKNGATKVYKVHDLLEVQTGNMQGPTRQGIDDRIRRDAPNGCPGNGKLDVLVEGMDAKGDKVWTIRPGCEKSPRLIVLPVVDRIKNPQKSEILAFAVIFLTGESGSGGQQTIEGEFVTLVSALPDSLYDGVSGSGASAALLIE